VATIVNTDHPGSTSVDSYDFVFLFAGVWIPDDRTIDPPLTSPEQSIGDLFALFRAIFDVAFQEVQCVARLFGCRGRPVAAAMCRNSSSILTS